LPQRAVFVFDKESKVKTILTAIVLLLAVTVVYAGDTTVTLTTPTIINGQKLAPGVYTLHFDIKGKTADIKVIQNAKTIAKTTGNVVENKDKSRYDSVVRENNTDGTATLKEIQISNKNQVIRFEEGTAVGK